ncbi:phage tail tape measure protein, TP901 family [Thermoanaerobacter sp. YS13]|uniref:phage tail tape measure protein n=1 Tax=Thermoanaerobacter sp. YS13 TaxID=1511746 RepID=UPI0005732AFB|nr:phage tail tape measure protein [Thermoanaerobacter sp. YS13]KHO62671.1 phage tail tape measure protein, TP901 family [Thermoanaerobacter sp. YS13]
MANEEIGKLNVVVNLDSTGFQNGISQLNRQMKLVQSEFQAATAKLGDFGSSTDKLKLQADALSKQIEIQKQKVAALEAAYQKSVETKGADAKATQDLAIKLNKAQAELANMENELKKTTTELEKQSSVWYKLSQSAKEAGEKLKDIGKKVTDVGESLTKKVTAPIMAAGTAAIKFAIDFENGMAKVATIADTSKVSLDSLKKGILELSNQTGISVNELTEAEYQAISAGVDTANSVKFLDAAVKAAKGGFTDTTTAVDALSTVLNAYGLKASEAKRITDEMMVAQNYGKTTFGEMAQSIGNVIPIASALNVSTKELFASLAVLTKNGIQTSEAVTGLKAAFSNIMKPSSEAAKLAEQLGLKFNAAHLQSVGWAKFLEEVREKTHGNAEMMAKLFGSVEALNAVTVLTGKGAQDFSQALKMMGDAAGTTDKAFEQVTNTSGAKLNKALNELKNSAIQFGDALSPVVQKLADILSMLAEKFNSLTPAQQQMIIQLAAIAAAIGPVILVVGKLITAVGTISTAFSALAGIMTTVSGASGIVGAAIAALTSPIGIAVAAIVGLTAVGIALYKNWDTIKQKGIELKDDLINTFNNMKEKIINAWDSLRTAASDIFNKIKEAILAPFRNLHIPLPHVSVSWRSIGVGPLSISIPDFDLKWYATGGIFTSPSIIGVGEAGPEAVIPIEKLTYIIRDALMQIQPQQTVRPQEIHLHVGTLVADDYSLKQLERKLMNIRILENNRLGVIGT